MLDTPVLFLVFNRPDTTRQVFEAIRRARPKQLFVAADGPRAGRPDDAESCRLVREIATQVDWECRVQTLFREGNLGCGAAVSSAITWFFEQVEEGIILEDDTLPDQSFFYFCTDLLGRYRHNEQVFYVSGASLIKGADDLCPQTYYFGRYGSIWGWASWRRSWLKYEYDLSSKAADLPLLVNKMSSRTSERAMLLNVFRSLCDGNIDTWDYQFLFAIALHDGLAAIPTRNLVQNIGFGENATHTLADDSAFSIASEEIKQIKHPEDVRRNELLDNTFLEKVLLLKDTKTDKLLDAMQKIKQWVDKAVGRDAPSTYKPKHLAKPAKMIEVVSAWKGLEMIVKDIIDTFSLPGNRCLEFGVEFGYSAVVFSNYFEKVTGVDIFQGDMHTSHKGDHYDQTKSSLRHFENIELVKADYKDWINTDNTMYDLVHIDIVHTYEDTFKCGLWSAKHAKCVLFHDTESFPEVKAAVAAVARETGKKFYNYPNHYGLGIIV